MKNKISIKEIERSRNDTACMIEYCNLIKHILHYYFSGFGNQFSYDLSTHVAKCRCQLGENNCNAHILVRSRVVGRSIGWFCEERRVILPFYSTFSRRISKKPLRRYPTGFSLKLLTTKNAYRLLIKIAYRLRRPLNASKVSKASNQQIPKRL